MNRVLVLDSRVRSATAVIRNLGKKPDISVTAGGESKFLPGMLSKYSDRRFVYSRITDNPDKFVGEIKQYLDKNEYSAVIPVSDSTSLVCSKYKEFIEESGTIVGVEDWATFEIAYDKYKTVNAAKSVNVPCPDTFSPKSLEDVKNISDKISYPAVIKPRSKSLWSDENGILMRKVTDNNYPENRSELLKQFSQIFSDPILSEYPPLIQEYVPGEIMDTVVLSDDGRIQALLQNQRVRTYPRSGGAYTLAETVNEPQMVEYVEKLLDEIRWTGPAMFEFMKSDDDFYLMEINGRYWGSIGLSLSCGLDIPQMHYAQIRNEPFDSNCDYPVGVQQRWLLIGDLLWLFEGLIDGDLTSIRPFLQSFFTANHDLISFDDPLPAIGKLFHAGKLSIDVLSGNRNIYGEIN
jgi:predicted ATP-grasp superfamily ATP-dependent carboligase